MTRTRNTAAAAEVLRGIKASLPMTIGFVPIALILGATGAQTGMSAVGVASHYGGERLCLVSRSRKSSPFSACVPPPIRRVFWGTSF